MQAASPSQMNMSGCSLAMLYRIDELCSLNILLQEPNVIVASLSFEVVKVRGAVFSSLLLYITSSNNNMFLYIIYKYLYCLQISKKYSTISIELYKLEYLIAKVNYQSKKLYVIEYKKEYHCNEVSQNMTNNQKVLKLNQIN